MVQNYMEVLAEQSLREILETDVNKNICTCEHCRDDMLAYALNHLQPFYVTGKKGEVFAEYSTLNVQSKADILAAITKAIEVVSSNCNH